MCFWIDRIKKDSIVAAEDIECKKVVYKVGWWNIRQLLSWSLFEGKIYRSQFRDFYYTTNFLQKKIDLKINSYFIDKGYHSYHMNKKEILHQSDLVCIKCIIPKGTLYYKNDSSKEYVSETIIVTDTIL